MLNGIVLVSFPNKLRQAGLGIREAVFRGTALRLRSVLMTASVAILGLMPMMLSSSVGAETQRPLKAVVIGGLITSTLLTLLLPVLYEWMAERRRAWEAPCKWWRRARGAGGVARMRRMTNAWLFIDRPPRDWQTTPCW
jgi:cobalt-zinc-cadmium resistance protein CzcA